MILLKDADWYQQSIYKLDYVLMEIEFLKSVRKLSVYEQIRVNTLLNILKTPMEYAIQALTRFKGITTTSSIPHKQKHHTEEKYKHHIQKKFGWVDESILTILNKLFENDLYESFNNMQNSEKHSHINIQVKTISKDIGYTKQNNIIMQDIKVIGNEDNIDNLIKFNDKEIDWSRVEGYDYNEILYFEYNNREVFSFLDDVYQMVNNFVIDIKEYIDDH